MSYKIFLPCVFLFTIQSVCAGEPDWNEAKWVCPASVKVGKVVHKLFNAGVFYGPPEELAQSAPLPGKAPQHIQLDNENIYLVCEYESLATNLIIHAKGASFCGYNCEFKDPSKKSKGTDYCGYGKAPFRAACWLPR